MSAPREEIEAELRRHDEAAVARASRNPRALLNNLAVVVAISAASWLPGAEAALGVPALDVTLVLAAIALMLVVTTRAFLEHGMWSRAFFLASAVEMAVLSCGSLYLVFRSGDAVSVFWLWHLAVLVLNVAVDWRRVHVPALVVPPLALAIAFLATGKAGDAGIVVVVAGTFALTWLLAFATLRARLTRQIELALTTRRGAEDEVKEQRSRIARDLHDGIGAELAAILWRARELELSGDEGRRREGLSEILAAASQGLEELREISDGLSEGPTSLDGVARALELRVRPLGAGVSVVAAFDDGGRAVPAALAGSLVRAGLEAVRNALGHGEAERVEVSLSARGDALTLVVDDDGKGLPRDASAAEGRGLANLRARAERARGTFAMSSSERGVRVELRVPLDG